MSAASGADRIVPTVPAVIACERLFRRFRTAGTDVEVLKGVDLRVDAGETAVVLGPSGSGKSTLLHLLAGLDRPDSGSIWWGDTPLHGKTPSQLAGIRAWNVGLVFQQHYLLEDLTVLENVLIPMRIVGSVDEARGRELLARVGLSERADFYPAQISGGERQRAAVARALSLDPPCVIADEPTGSLDHARAVEVFRLLVDLSRSGKAIIIVTHDEDLLSEAVPAAAELSVYRLADGRLSEQTAVGAP